MSLISLFNSSNKNIRKAGYVKDQKGIIRRYYQEFSNWQNHLDNCKEFIISQAKYFTGGKVAILGSGWLLDVPMDELLNVFDEIHLLDINHPQQIIRKYKNTPSVKFISSDLTNGLIDFAANSKNLDEFMQSVSIVNSIEFKEKYDLVISVNILNQLDIILCDFIKEKYSASDENILRLRKIIQQNHVDMLSKYKSCLISDSIEQLIHNNIIIEERNLIYCNLPTKANLKSWIWVFDTHKTYYAKYNTSFIVKTYIF